MVIRNVSKVLQFLRSRSDISKWKGALVINGRHCNVMAKLQVSSAQLPISACCQIYVWLRHKDHQDTVIVWETLSLKESDRFKTVLCGFWSIENTALCSFISLGSAEGWLRLLVDWPEDSGTSLSLSTDSRREDIWALSTTTTSEAWLDLTGKQACSLVLMSGTLLHDKPLLQSHLWKRSETRSFFLTQRSPSSNIGIQTRDQRWRAQQRPSMQSSEFSQSSPWCSDMCKKKSGKIWWKNNQLGCTYKNVRRWILNYSAL